MIPSIELSICFLASVSSWLEISPAIVVSSASFKIELEQNLSKESRLGRDYSKAVLWGINVCELSWRKVCCLSLLIVVCGLGSRGFQFAEGVLSYRNLKMSSDSWNYAFEDGAREV